MLQVEKLPLNSHILTHQLTRLQTMDRPRVKPTCYLHLAVLSVSSFPVDVIASDRPQTMSLTTPYQARFWREGFYII